MSVSSLMHQAAASFLGWELYIKLIETPEDKAIIGLRQLY